MLLLLELHGDLPDHFPNDERRLYMFGCPRKPCNRKPGSIRAFRATRKVSLAQTQQQKPAEEKEAPAPALAAEAKPKPADLGASLFGTTSLTNTVSSNPNPFSSSTGGDSPANPFAAPTPVPAPATDKTKTDAANALAETFADKVRVSSPSPAAPQPGK